jgi:hypothetical protein
VESRRPGYSAGATMDWADYSVWRPVSDWYGVTRVDPACGRPSNAAGSAQWLVLGEPWSTGVSTSSSMTYTGAISPKRTRGGATCTKSSSTTELCGPPSSTSSTRRGVDAINTFRVSAVRVTWFRVLSRTRISCFRSSSQFLCRSRFPAAPLKRCRRGWRRKRQLTSAAHRRAASPRCGRGQRDPPGRDDHRHSDVSQCKSLTHGHDALVALLLRPTSRYRSGRSAFPPVLRQQRAPDPA